MLFQHDFYTYSDLKDLIIKNELSKEDILKCRTIAVLQSVHGKFFLTDVSTQLTQFTASSLHNLHKEYTIYRLSEYPTLYTRKLKINQNSKAFHQFQAVRKKIK